MNVLRSFVLIFNLFILYGCSLNTKFDDSKYRPVGASAPLNSDIHSISITKKKAVDKESEVSSTRYVLPGSKAPDSAISGSTSTLPVINTSTSNTSTSISETSVKEDIISTTLKEVFISRYGDIGTIKTIAQTVLIHCNDKTLKQSTNPEMRSCHYQFPRFCGAHRFAVFSRGNKQLLMFVDQKSQRNIIDTLTGDQQSTAGLWDKDDYISSELLTFGQLLNNKAIDDNNLGWIENISKNEKAQFGRSYEAAINATRKCF